MSFSGTEDHTISLYDAAEITKRYRDKEGSGAVLGGYFSKTFLNSILAQPNCCGIRIYYGLDQNNKPKPVIVGVSANMDDITNGILGEHSWDCPPYCSSPNLLNS